MPLRNRVTPFGAIISTPANGTLDSMRSSLSEGISEPAARNCGIERAPSQAARQADNHDHCIAPEGPNTHSERSHRCAGETTGGSRRPARVTGRDRHDRPSSIRSRLIYGTTSPRRIRCSTTRASVPAFSSVELRRSDNTVGTFDVRDLHVSALDRDLRLLDVLLKRLSLFALDLRASSTGGGKNETISNVGVVKPGGETAAKDAPAREATLLSVSLTYKILNNKPTATVKVWGYD